MLDNLRKIDTLQSQMNHRVDTWQKILQFRLAEKREIV